MRLTALQIYGFLMRKRVLEMSWIENNSFSVIVDSEGTDTK